MLFRPAGRLGACVSGPTLRIIRNTSYYHVRKRWTPHEYNETEEKRKFLASITDKDAIMANVNKRFEDPENAEWPAVQRISKRTGLIGRKLGSYRYWTRNGRSYCCTLVHVSSRSLAAPLWV